MSRKSKKRPARPRKPAAPPRFAPGQQVTVKHGVPDPDFPDIPLGGWSGSILDVDPKSNQPTYRIEWDRRTLDQMHPVYRQRCERDGLDLETMWLAENDIESASAELVPIEQPVKIVARPLKISDPDDRIRAIFGLTSDDPLPPVTDENLSRYRDYLAENLKLPFRATYDEETEPYLLEKRKIDVVALLAAEEGDEEMGLVCEAMEGSEKLTLPLAGVLVRNGRNRQLIGDYRLWLWSGDAEELRFVEPSGNGSSGGKALTTTLVMAILVGSFYAAALGAAWASLDGVDFAAKVGAILLALVGGLLAYGAFFRVTNGPGRIGFIGATIGAVVGGMLGAMLVAFVGSLVGALAGVLFGKIIGMKVRQPLRWSVVVGAMIGVIVQAWMNDAEQAVIGMRIGAVMGAILGPVVFVAIVVALPGSKDARR